MFQWLNNARARAAEWVRARQEEAAANKIKRADPPGVTVPEWLVRSGHIISWMAWATAAYFLWSYCIQIAGDQSNPLHITHAGTWVGQILFFFPLVFGFFLISLGIPYLAKGIIPIFVALDWRANFWPKLWALALVLAASFALVASSFSVMGGAIIEHGRGAAVAVEQVQQGHAGLQAQIDGEQADLRDMMNNRNAYMAQAANVGAAAWASTYIAQARRTHDERLPMIERALGAAQAADARRAHIAQLRVQLAQATTVAAVAATPASEQSNWIVGVMAWIRGAWALIMSVLNDIVCLLMGWIALRLEQVRNAQLGMAGGIPKHSYMIEDHEGEPSVANMNAQAAAYEILKRGGSSHEAAEAARAAVRPERIKEQVFDAETGEPLHKVKEHFRKTGKKKKTPDGKLVEEVVIAPPVAADESGAPPGTDHGDGGLRSAALHGEHEPLATQSHQENDVQSQEADIKPNEIIADRLNSMHDAGTITHPEISEEEALAAQEELMADDSAPPTLGVVNDTENIAADATDDEGPGDNINTELHDSLLQTPPQQVADLPEADENQPAPQADDDAERGDHVEEGRDEEIEAVFAHAASANGRAPETDPRRLLEAAE